MTSESVLLQLILITSGILGRENPDGICVYSTKPFLYKKKSSLFWEVISEIKERHKTASTSRNIPHLNSAKMLISTVFSFFAFTAAQACPGTAALGWKLVEILRDITVFRSCERWKLHLLQRNRMRWVELWRSGALPLREWTKVQQGSRMRRWRRLFSGNDYRSDDNDCNDDDDGTCWDGDERRNNNRCYFSNICRRRKFDSRKILIKKNQNREARSEASRKKLSKFNRLRMIFWPVHLWL